VQDSTAGAAGDINRISGIIREVSEIVSTIAAAIEEQAAATKDIARNVEEASVGVNHANQRVAESSQVSTGIAADISKVDHEAREIAAGNEHVRTSAENVAKVSDELKHTISRFQV
jgi:methyl-accepting chemotaxis protein